MGDEVIGPFFHDFFELRDRVATAVLWRNGHDRCRRGRGIRIFIRAEKLGKDHDAGQGDDGTGGDDPGERT